MADAKTPTILDVQLFLNRTISAGLEPDGEKGPKTTAAVAKFQLEKMGMNPPTGILDPRTLGAMFPQMDQKSNKPLTIQARLEDYFLNLITSKINGMAAAGVGLIATWLLTKYNFDLPAGVKDWITGGIASAVLAAIMWWRTRGTDPSKIASVAPSVIKDPTKYK